MAALDGAAGVVNATPMGMVGHPRSPVPAALMEGRRWCFDAVYTPMRTPFVESAEAAGVLVLSGFELFFHQGLDAFRLFTGQRIDAPELRAALLAEHSLTEADLVR